MAKSKLFRPDLLVALTAVIIGVLTMFVYIYQARLMSQQMQAATWPYVEIIFSNSEDRFSIHVTNKGAGPAIVKTATVQLDGISYQDTQRNLDSVTYLLTGKRKLLDSYTNVHNRVMAPGEVINFIEINDSTSVALFLESLQKHSAGLEICYCSVFDKCWKATGGKVEPCDDCEESK
jgi:hypothetical protein